MDEEGIFNTPVVEAVPGIRESYLEIIEQPMDFSTIIEDRMQEYRSIKELQHDLLLIFQNCIKFNGQFSEYGRLARTMMDSMDDAFGDAISDL